ncbi:LPS assembly lipoprotein LptE [Gilvimarinus sp. SDUM040013]|uniref:LPS-assembly lipoprotein LptE n=1 Tax=Gilvimarinus gilvus TaxID=3058038 RepID=A0ABU4RWP0_9GAMM|nr:LPS assembly lipoprotein LptE [Gilvimarinus sp. SDUM040013]MDO3387028.1 LPS assembly lipoprotein LptE [Gilvimarinus sp. SDUM040013]MDX6848078.1 LPS assembly lipoprotein LptE [Gilvimarinus sp. SDUM040013]
MTVRMFAIWAMLVTGVLAGCGWQVRGNLLPPLALDSVRIASSEQYTPLLQILTDAFVENDIDVVGAGEKAQYVLVLEDEDLRKRTVGVGTDSLAAAFELQLSQPFQWFDTQAVAVTSPLSAIVTRSLDASDTTGIEREQELLLDDMRRELVQQILRQSYFQLQPEQAAQE